MSYERQSVSNRRKLLIKKLVRAYHYSDVIIRAMASQITSVSIACSIICSSAGQRTRQSSLVFVRGIHRRPVDSPHNGPVMPKIIRFDDVIMQWNNPQVSALLVLCDANLPITDGFPRKGSIMRNLCSFHSVICFSALLWKLTIALSYKSCTLCQLQLEQFLWCNVTLIAPLLRP